MIYYYLPLTKFNHFTLLNMHFLRWANPLPGRFNPPIAFMAAFDVSGHKARNYGLRWGGLGGGADIAGFDFIRADRHLDPQEYGSEIPEIYFVPVAP